MINTAYAAYAFNDPTNNRWISETDIYDGPEVDVQADELAELDGALIVKQRIKSKPFYIRGVVRSDSIANLETALDAFKTAIYTKNQAFDIDYAGTSRRYLATLKGKPTIAKRLTSFAYTVNFISPDGVGWSLDTTSLLDATSITTSPVDNAITALGTYQVEPLITVQINTVTGGTSKNMTVTSGTTLRGITINRTWAAGDFIEIDSLNKTVFVNNVSTSFTGTFPRFDPGASVISYLDEFTTRDVTISATYTRRWL